MSSQIDECEINGERQPCVAYLYGISVEGAKKLYSGLECIGSGTKIWVKGEEKVLPQEGHFFVKKEKVKK